MLSHAATYEPLRGAVADVVVPAYRRMAEFLVTYHREHARADPGVWAGHR
jgi:uncharacterized protein (DUF885 family)